jgi:hypothetical protein
MAYAAGPWSARDEQDTIRWYSAGMSFRVIGDSLTPRRSVFEVREKLQELGYSREPKKPLFTDEPERARAALKREVALGRAEIRAGTAPPYKGEIAWPK